MQISLFHDSSTTSYKALTFTKKYLYNMYNIIISQYVPRSNCREMDWELHLTYCNISYTNCVMCCLDSMNSAKTRWLFICTWRHQVAIHDIYKRKLSQNGPEFFRFSFLIIIKRGECAVIFSPQNYNDYFMKQMLLTF